MSIIHVTDSEFDNTVMKDPGVVVVDFWAPWCGPCRALGPIFEEVDSMFQGKDVKFVKVNVDENPATAQRFGVRGIPFLVMIKNGNVVGTHVGLLNKAQLTEFVENEVG